MRRIILITACCWLSHHAYSQTGFYDLSIDTTGGGSVISMSAFAGRPVLIVNVASQSPCINQQKDLEELKEIFIDSGLVIIAIPANDFGHEPLGETDIAAYYDTSFNNTLVLANKAVVTGSSRHSLYQWLTSLSLNGVAESEVTNDYTKYLIDRNGNLVGVFDHSNNPLEYTILQAIQPL